MFHSRHFCFLSKTGFIVSVHSLITITLLTVVQVNFKGGRRPISSMRTHTIIRAIGVSNTQLAKVSFDEIFDLIEEVYFNIIRIYPGSD